MGDRWLIRPDPDLWRPKQIANDIYRASNRERRDQQPTWSDPVSPLLHWWWALWSFSGLMSRFDSAEWTNGVSLRTLRSAPGLDIATEATSATSQLSRAGLAAARLLGQPEGKVRVAKTESKQPPLGRPRSRGRCSRAAVTPS
jgi:hypothetical protein